MTGPGATRTGSHPPSPCPPGMSSAPDRPYVGRFAPTPSGPLHAGSVLAAVISWLDARAVGGRWHLRIDDIDLPRVRAGAEDAILATLDVLGLGWDGPLTRQSNRDDAYAAAVDHLLQSGHAFACACTRREIRTAGVAGWEGPVYPGTCRPGLPPGREGRSVRARAVTRRWTVEDRFQGPLCLDLEALGGDFVIRRAGGLHAYQLATVIDDHELGVTDVVRGIDLLGSTARQLQLYAALGLAPPEHAHHPVLVGGDGDKLSKHTGAARVHGDAARRVLARTLEVIELTPSDPLCPDAPEVQLQEALDRLARRPLTRRLPPASHLPWPAGEA